MKNRFLIVVAVLLAMVCAVGTHASTFNGVLNQFLSGFTAHAVLIGQGASADVTVAGPGTSGLPLVGAGSSADPTFMALANAGLVNSSVTINTTGCIGGGGAVSLGGTLSLTSSSCGSFTGVTNATPGASPTWVLQNGDIAWTLSANATATVTVVSGDQWVPHRVQICQPASGGPYTLTWPANIKGGMVIGTTASKCNMQVMESYDGTNVYSVSTGVLNQ